MNYRHDLLRWRRNETGDTYESISGIAGLSRNTVYLVVKGATDPTASTIKSTFKAMGLDPKFAMDFSLRRSEFRRAVVEAAR